MRRRPWRAVRRRRGRGAWLARSGSGKLRAALQRSACGAQPVPGGPGHLHGHLHAQAAAGCRQKLQLGLQAGGAAAHAAAAHPFLRPAARRGLGHAAAVVADLQAPFLVARAAPGLQHHAQPGGAGVPGAAARPRLRRPSNPPAGASPADIAPAPAPGAGWRYPRRPAGPWRPRAGSRHGRAGPARCATSPAPPLAWPACCAGDANAAPAGNCPAAARTGQRPAPAGRIATRPPIAQPTPRPTTATPGPSPPGRRTGSGRPGRGQKAATRGRQKATPPTPAPCVSPLARLASSRAPVRRHPFRTVRAAKQIAPPGPSCAPAACGRCS